MGLNRVAPDVQRRDPSFAFGLFAFEPRDYVSKHVGFDPLAAHDGVLLDERNDVVCDPVDNQATSQMCPT